MDPRRAGSAPAARHPVRHRQHRLCGRRRRRGGEDRERWCDLDRQGRRGGSRAYLGRVRRSAHLPRDHRARRSAAAHERRWGHVQLDRSVQRQDLCRRLRIAGDRGRGRRVRRDGGVERCGCDLGSGRGPPRRKLHAPARDLEHARLCARERGSDRPHRRRRAHLEHDRGDHSRRRRGRGVRVARGRVRAGRRRAGSPHRQRRHQLVDSRHGQLLTSAGDARAERRGGAPDRAARGRSARATVARASHGSRAGGSARSSSSRSTAAAARSSPTARRTCSSRPTGQALAQGVPAASGRCCRRSTSSPAGSASRSGRTAGSSRRETAASHWHDLGGDRQRRRGRPVVLQRLARLCRAVPVRRRPRAATCSAPATAGGLATAAPDEQADLRPTPRRDRRHRLRARGRDSLFFTTSGATSGERVQGDDQDLPPHGRAPERRSGSAARQRRRGRGPTVLVSRRQRGESGWDFQVGHGRVERRPLRTTWQLAKTATFVAQWPGDDDQAGDGSAPRGTCGRPGERSG